MMKRSRVRLGVAAALMAGSSCLVLAGAWHHAVQVVTRNVRHTFRTLPGLGIGAVEVDMLRGRIVLRDVTIDRPGLRIDVARLASARPVLPTFGLVIPEALAETASEPAGVPMGDVSADDIRVTLGRTKISIPHLEARGTALSASELAGLFDAQQPGSLEERLAKLSARSITASALTLAPADDATAAREGVLTFHSIALNDVRAGKIKALSAQSASVAGGTSPSTSGTLDAGPIAAAGLDIPLAVEIVEGSRTDKDAPLAALYESFSIASMKFVETAPQTQAFEIGSIEGSGLEARPLLVPIRAYRALFDKAPETRTDAERKTLADLTVDALQSAVPGHIALHDLSFAQSGQDSPVSLKLGTVALDASDVLKIASFVVEDVSMATPDADFTLKRFGVEGLDQTGLARVLRDAGSLPSPDSSMADMQAMAPKFSKVSLDTLHLQVPAKGLDGNSADGSLYVLDVPVAALEAGGYVGTMPTTTTTRIEIVYDVAPTAPNPGLQSLVQAGFGHFDVTTESALAFDAGQGAFRVDHLSVAAKDLGAVTLHGALSHVSPDLFGADDDARTTALQAIKLDTLEFGLLNQGLADKALPLWAGQNDMTVTAFKTDLKLKFHEAVLEALGESPAADQIVRAGSAFIDTPRTFNLKVVAPHGIGMSDVAAAQDPKDVLGLLDVTATANQ